MTHATGDTRFTALAAVVDVLAGFTACDLPQLLDGCITLLGHITTSRIQPVKLRCSLSKQSATMHTAVMLMPTAKAGQRAGLHFQLSEGLDELIGFHMCPLLPHKTN